MAEQFDVAARLAEGRPTVDDVEEYVAACRSLGYQHRDLTAHPTQVRDWYDGDDGMDLRVLDSDHRALSAAALAAEEAASRQADLAAQLTAAWAGRGGAAADEFLSRSCQAAQSVSAAVRRAADAAAALRDAQWHAVDAKVAATEAVAGSQAPHRVEWLAAARTVTRGGADLDAAGELVRQRVMPFVDADVASDWVGAMRAAMTSIDAAYDAAVAALASLPRTVFEVPGDLGPEPSRVDALRDDPVATVSVAQTIPASFGPGGSAAAGVAPSAWGPAASGVGPASAGWAPAPGTTPAAAWAPDPAWSGSPPAAAPPPPPAPVTPPTPPMGDLGVGTQGSGVSGLGQQLAGLLSELVGSAGGASSNDDALDGNPANDPAADDDPDEKDQDDPEGEDEPEDDPDGPDHDPDPPAPEEKDPVDDGCAAGKQPAGAPPAQAPAAAAPPTDAPSVTAPPEPPPPAAPPPEPAPPAPAAEQTPCEKAADAVPQVGE